MVRKTSLALVIATVLSPISAHALGLGDIHLKSALNQNLRADIDLLSVKPGELDTVKIELAGPDVFKQAGVDRSYLLTLLRFRPVRRPDGSAVIEVTTRDAVREPFLDFLVEVNWPQGKLVREYTVLLDPPATLSRRPPAVAAPVTRTPAMPASATVSERATTAPAVSPPGMPGEYGPVRANETLWVIADKLRPSGVTIEQMMMALQRANPDAFYKDNVNYLKRGVILRVPKEASIDTLSAADAHTKFRAQTARWEADRAPQPETKPAVETAEAPPSSAVPKAPAAAPATAPTEAELKIVGAPAEGEAGAGEGGLSDASVDTLKSELVLAREASASAKQEAADLQSRVKDLEAQLADMRSLVSLKDDQLAQLQTTLAAGGGKAAEGSAQPEEGQPKQAVPAETAGAAAPSAPAQATESEPSGPTAETGEAGPGAAPGAEAQAPAEAAAEAAVAPAQPSEAEALAEQPSVPETSEPMAAEQPAVATTEPEATPAAPSEAQAPETAVAMPKPQPQPISLLYWILGGALGVLVLGLGWTAVRRRKAEQAAQPEESILIDLDEEVGEAPSQMTGTSGESDTQTDETSFLSDFSPSDIDALQDETGEVDPVSEADVYMAYNRYQQAEELLRQAIAKEPERADLRFKLLEVLGAAQSVAAFVAEAEKASGDGLAQDHPTEWAKVQSLGSDLAPESPLFAETEAGKIEAKEPVARSGEETAVIQDAGRDASEQFADLDLGDLQSELDMATSGMAAPPEAEPEREEGVEFGDSVFEFVNREPPSPDSQTGDEVEIESSSDFIAESRPALGESEPAVSELDLGDFSDLDQGLGEVPGQAEQPADDSAVEMGSGLAAEDLDYERMEPIPDQDSVNLEGLNSAMSDLEEAEDLSLEDEQALVSPEAASPADLSAEPGDDDEVATKLDLARAYIDMGDEEGARSILDEVLSEGSEAQQSEARGLMQRLA